MTALKNCIEKLLKQHDLSSDEISLALNEILNQELNVSQAAAFMMLLRAKKEKASEVLAIVKAMQEHMVPVEINKPVLDITGTGGDQIGSMNISTVSAILAAACGITIAKHGNRAVSSQCGSADVLEELGIPMSLTAKQVEQCIDKIGIGFLFAPNFHPAFQKIREVRKQLNVPTIFNLIGPLLNPAKPKHYLLGVADEDMVILLSEVLMMQGAQRSVVFHSEGLDELTCLSTIEYVLIENDSQKKYQIDPFSLGLSRCTFDDLKGGDAKHNAMLAREVLSGKKMGLTDTIILNAAMALYTAGHHNHLKKAVEHARGVLEEGRALTLLDSWINHFRDEKHD